MNFTFDTNQSYDIKKDDLIQVKPGFVLLWGPLMDSKTKGLSLNDLSQDWICMYLEPAASLSLGHKLLAPVGTIIVFGDITSFRKMEL